MEYNFNEIERRWQKRWAEMKTYHVTEDTQKEKFYVLNMFPYPSGAGLHVGHPLGYIASDIYARYKRLKGFNVLNPMGYDAYGLPAEQYAIQTGQHPAVTTDENINHYREQLDKIGFSFDWDREVRTCDPKYYHWTQWAFIRMFNSYYDNSQQKARPIEELEKYLSEHGTEGLDAACSEELKLTATEWNAMTEKEKRHTLMNWRLAYLGETMVNWCAGLGTVLANDEVVDGVSVRGGYPVVQKKMMQWCLRVSAYAQRLLDGLDTVEWTDSLKETQRNWIGRSEGTEIEFKIAPHKLPRGELPIPTKQTKTPPRGRMRGALPSSPPAPTPSSALRSWCWRLKVNWWRKSPRPNRRPRWTLILSGRRSVPSASASATVRSAAYSRAVTPSIRSRARTFQSGFQTTYWQDTAREP